MNETNVFDINNVFVHNEKAYFELTQDFNQHFVCMFCESSDEITIQDFPYCMTCVLEMTENPSKEDSFLSGCLP